MTPLLFLMIKSEEICGTVAQLTKAYYATLLQEWTVTGALGSTPQIAQKQHHLDMEA